MSFQITINRQTKISMIVAVILVLVLAVAAPATYAYEGISVKIPALNIETGLTEFGLNGTSWNINPWESGLGHLQGTGWFNGGSNIAIGGHSWMPNMTPGIFVNLHTMKPGDQVIVNVNGEERRYAVSNVTSVSMYDLSVLYPVDGEQITLITCDAASFEPSSNFYGRRIIVTAQRVA